MKPDLPVREILKDNQDSILPLRRLPGLDLCRSLICVLMALDHATYLLWSEAREPSFLFWYGPFVSDEVLPETLIRLGSNLCAPGFFLLMGAGISMFAQNRRQLLWSEPAIQKHFVSRGILLIALQFTVENSLWSLKPNESWFNYVGVLYALGVSLRLAALCAGCQT